MNTIILTGRLVRDPEFFNEGTPRVNFTIAVDRRSTKNGDKADFFRCVAWDGEKVKTASAIKDYFVKGKPITISGRMENDPYTDKDERLRDSWAVKVERWEFAISDPTQKQKAGTGNGLAPVIGTGNGNAPVIGTGTIVETDSFKAAEDDIPF